MLSPRYLLELKSKNYDTRLYNSVKFLSGQISVLQTFFLYVLDFQMDAKGLMFSRYCIELILFSIYYLHDPYCSSH